MAQFKTARMTDGTLVSSVDNEVGNLEVDHAAIFGIPTNTEIAGAVFGSIDATARITGTLKFANAASDPEVAAGAEFQAPGSERYKIFALGDGLRLYIDDGGGTYAAGPKLDQPVVDFKDLSDGFDITPEGGKVVSIAADGLSMIPLDLSTFGVRDLADTPSAYGTIGQYLVMNATLDGMAWQEPPDPPSGASNFLDLSDTPGSYAGQASKTVKVNAGGNALEFTDVASGTFLAATDTPSSYSGQAGKVAKVNTGEDALEFGDAAPSAFLGLTDTPGTYPATADGSLANVRVNSARNALEFMEHSYSRASSSQIVAISENSGSPTSLVWNRISGPCFQASDRDITFADPGVYLVQMQLGVSLDRGFLYIVPVEETSGQVVNPDYIEKVSGQFNISDIVYDPAGSFTDSVNQSFFVETINPNSVLYFVAFFDPRGTNGNGALVAIGKLSVIRLK